MTTTNDQWFQYHIIISFRDYKSIVKLLITEKESLVAISYLYRNFFSPLVYENLSPSANNCFNVTYTYVTAIQASPIGKITSLKSFIAFFCTYRYAKYNLLSTAIYSVHVSSPDPHLMITSFIMFSNLLHAVCICIVGIGGHCFSISFIVA